MTPRPVLSPDEQDDLYQALRSAHAWDLSVHFDFADGRFMQTLAVDIGPSPDGDAAATLVAAVEIEPDPDAPERLAGPVFQELGPREDRGPMLLVGRVGRHHISASIERAFGPERSGGWLFDLADRCTVGIPRFAATYHVVLPPSLLVEAGSDRVVWRPETLGGGELMLEVADPDEGPRSRIAVAEAGRNASLVQIAAPTPAGATARCRYRWLWRRGPGTPGDTWA